MPCLGNRGGRSICEGLFPNRLPASLVEVVLPAIRRCVLCPAWRHLSTRSGGPLWCPAHWARHSWTCLSMYTEMLVQSASATYSCRCHLKAGPFFSTATRQMLPQGRACAMEWGHCRGAVTEFSWRLLNSSWQHLACQDRRAGQAAQAALLGSWMRLTQRLVARPSVHRMPALSSLFSHQSQHCARLSDVQQAVQARWPLLYESVYRWPAASAKYTWQRLSVTE